jgi:hypothetical protein
VKQLRTCWLPCGCGAMQPGRTQDSVWTRAQTPAPVTAPPLTQW